MNGVKEKRSANQMVQNKKSLLQYRGDLLRRMMSALTGMICFRRTDACWFFRIGWFTGSLDGFHKNMDWFHKILCLHWIGYGLHSYWQSFMNRIWFQEIGWFLWILNCFLTEYIYK